MHLPCVGTGGEPGDHVELMEQMAHDTGSVRLAAEAIELRHDTAQRALGLANRALGVVLTLFLETALTSDELFAVKGREGVEGRVASHERVGQEA